MNLDSMRYFFWLFCGLCVLNSHSVVHAYKANTSGGKILRWSESDLPLPWYMNMNGYTGVSSKAAESAFKHGMQQWSSQACSSFRTVYKGTIQKGNRSDGFNVLSFGYLSAGSSTTAITYTRWGSKKRYTDADIVFRRTKPWSVQPNSSQLDLRGTATHEIGHLLGLSHSRVQTATMYAKTGLGPSARRFLDPDDIQGVCAIYPVSNASGKRGSPCGRSIGAKCSAGLLCIVHSGSAGFCVEPCQGSQCPQGGRCMTQGTQTYCGCDTNADCGTGKLCRGRNCFPDPAYCTKDSDCSSQQMCDKGACVSKPPPPQCTQDSDCPSGSNCTAGKCVGTTGQRGALCGRSSGGAKCQSGLLCVNKRGQPAYCLELCQSGQCPNGGKCLKTTSGSQFCACDQDADCNNNQICRNRTCFARTDLCTRDSQCPSGKRCLQGRCQLPPPECTKDSECTAPQVCKQGRCVEPPPQCVQDSDCPALAICEHGQCKEKPKKGMGQPCTDASECVSNVCEAIASDGKTYCTSRCGKQLPPCPVAYQCSQRSGAGEICVVSKQTPCTKDSECVSPRLCQQGRCIVTQSEPSLEDGGTFDRPSETAFERSSQESHSVDTLPGEKQQANERSGPRPRNSGCVCSMGSDLPGTSWLVLICFVGICLCRRKKASE